MTDGADMTINLYSELMRIAGSRGWEHTRRLIGYALRLCGFYKGADADAVLAAAILRGHDADDIRGILSRAEWPEDRTELAAGGAALLSGDGGITPGGTEKNDIVYRSDAVENRGAGLGKKYNTAPEHDPDRKNGKFTSGFSTVSTDFSTTASENGGADAENLPLEAKILIDAEKLCTRGVYAEAERLKSLGRRNSPSLYDFASGPAGGNDDPPALFTRQAKQICRELDRNAKIYRDMLSAECTFPDDELDRFELTSVTDEPIYRRLALVRTGSGFYMDGFHVWGGSVIKHKDRYHLLAARWKTHLGFPEGYIKGAETVHAVSDSPLGPFRFTNSVLSIRQRGKWDSQMSCDPKIIRIRDLRGDLFLLYYTGAPCADESRRRISAASARSPEGPWKRPDEPIELGGECFAPAPLQDRDGSILLAFCLPGGRIGIARAKRWDGEYETLSADILPGKPAADPFIFIHDGRYCMIVRDAEGRITGKAGHGGMLISDDAVRWKPAAYPRAYDNTLMYSDMSVTEAETRALPFILTENGEPKTLYTSVISYGAAGITAQEINDR